MPTIRRHFWLRHFLGSATDYVIHLRDGAVAHSGVGQAFWFHPGTSVLSEIPVTDQELPVLFHAITRDQQNVSVQANITFRFADPALASQRLDFGIFPPRPSGSASGREQVATIIGQLVQSVAVDVVAAVTLAEALETGVSRVRQTLTTALADDIRLRATGIEVLGVRVLAVRPEADIEKALQTPVREQLQAEADRAVYERRAVAVERERAISENELASQIELATRREQLVAQEGSNKRREAEDAAAVELVASQSSAQRRGIESEARAAEIRRLGDAQAAKEQALMDVYSAVGRDVLNALALRDAAAKLPQINNLTITPDVLTGVLGRLLNSSTAGSAPAVDTPGESATGESAR